MHCSPQKGHNCLRLVSVEQPKQFKWETYDDLKAKALILFTILNAACGSKRANLTLCVPVVAAVHLKYRSKQMGLLQTVVSTILHAGHASKRVTNII